MEQEIADAVVIGAGPNGLVAANLLADAGWDVLVLEASRTRIGGACSPSCASGLRHDLYSSFYPLGAASPVIARSSSSSTGCAGCMRRPSWPTCWPDADARPAVAATWTQTARASTRTSRRATASLEPAVRALGAHPRRRCSTRCSPPSRRCGRSAARCVARRPPTLLDFARFARCPCAGLGDELFGGDGARAARRQRPARRPPAGAAGQRRLRLAARHARPGRRLPVPEGGAGVLSPRWRRRLRALGRRRSAPARGSTRCASSAGRARRCRTARRHADRRAAAPCSPTSPRRSSSRPAGRPGAPAGPAAGRARRFQCDQPTVKVNWALTGPIPWLAEARDARRHGAPRRRRRRAWPLAGGPRPGNRPRPTPFLLVGQMATADPTRAPAGGETRCGLYTPPAASRRRGRSRRDGARARRPHGAARSRRVAPGLPRPRPSTAASQLPPTLEADDAILVARRGQRRHRAAPPAARLPAACPGSAAPRRRSTGSTSPPPRPTPAAACTVRPATWRPRRRSTARRWPASQAAR